MKNVKKFRAFLGGFILFLALMFTVGSVNVKAAAPKLNKKKITIYVGHTGKLKVNNARKKVKWTSSKKQIAAVSSKGVVKGKKAGSAVITAVAGNKKWTCKVTVRNNVSVSKGAIKILPGKSKKVNIKIQKDVNNIRFKIKDPKVVSCKWGKWKGMSIPLTITAKQSGSTYITLTNTYSKEKVKINVTVPAEWDDVEVVIPETIGEQGYESNRMKITNYSFYKPYDWQDGYYMNVDFKMVQYGKPGKTNWGEYVFFYDKNGNILNKAQLFASSLAVGKSFNDELSVPKGTAKIVFMEYPDVSGDHNNSGNDNGNGNDGTQDGDNSSTKDPLKWDDSDLKKMDSYADAAKTSAKQAWDQASKAKSQPSVSKVYIMSAIAKLKIARENIQAAYDYAKVKEDVNLIDADDNPAGTLQERTQELLSVFDGLDDLTNTDTDAVYNMATDAMAKTATYKVLTARLLL